jgi:hypothetical protein
MIRRSFTGWTALLIGLCICVSVARGQDPLEDLIKKQKISRQDRAAMETEISSRVQQLTEAGANAQLRKERTDYLIRMSRLKGASPEGLAAFAELAAQELAQVTNTSNFDSAFAAMLVIVDISHAQTSAALASALSSEHPAVRYLAARGSKSLHTKLADDAKRSVALLQALGEQGAKETDPLVREMIYKALDFNSDAADFKHANAQADAMVAVFAGRMTTLAAGSNDEAGDLAGISAAAACYSKASKDTKIRLIASVTGLMELAITRYFASQTSVESLPKLAEVITAEEKAIRSMIQASKVQPPAKTIASALSGNDRQKNEAPTRAALSELRTVLRGDPWKLP